MQHYMIYRLNILIMWKEMQLELEDEELRSEKKHYRLNPMSTTFALRWIKICAISSFNDRKQPQDIKSIAKHWTKVDAKHALPTEDTLKEQPHHSKDNNN